MRALVVAGARPNFMKVAPILRGLEAAGETGILVHTGQHYDAQMSDAFFRDLGLPEPAFHLGVGSGTHAQQTARVMEAFEPVLVEDLASADYFPADEPVLLPYQQRWFEDESQIKFAEKTRP